VLIERTEPRSHPPRRSLVFALLSLALAAAAGGDAPSVIVKSALEQVLSALADTEMPITRRRQASVAALSQHFDFAEMTARATATAWASADETQRARLVALFQTLLTDTYWEKIASYRDEKVEVLETRMSSETLASVKTMIYRKQSQIPVEYKMLSDRSTWKAYDVIIEQVSLVRHYRDEFHTVVHDAGIDGLIAHLERKTAARR